MSGGTGCQKCGECCRWLGFGARDLDGKALEFYMRRGLKVFKNEVGTYRVYVRHECPQLDGETGECLIYDKRPLACMEYEYGFEDPAIGDRCRWKMVETAD